MRQSSTATRTPVSPGFSVRSSSIVSVEMTSWFLFIRTIFACFVPLCVMPVTSICAITLSMLLMMDSGPLMTTCSGSGVVLPTS